MYSCAAKHTRARRPITGYSRMLSRAKPNRHTAIMGCQLITPWFDENNTAVMYGRVRYSNSWPRYAYETNEPRNVCHTSI